MKTLILLSGLNKEMNFQGELESTLKDKLKGLRKVVGIASTPEKFKINDMFFWGNEEWNGTVNMFKNVNECFTDFALIDARREEDEIVNLIEQTDLLYLMPGDPYTQMEFLQKSPKYMQAIKKFQGTILGVSAGTMNMAKQAYYLKDEDYNESRFYNGLGLTDVTVVPHFNNQSDILDPIRDSFKHEIYGLPEFSAIIIDAGENIEFIGKCYRFYNGNISIINKEKEDTLER